MSTALRRMVLGGATVLGLSACGTLPIREDFLMEVTSVELPATVGAADPLEVVVEVTVGGCIRFGRFEATRSAAQLNLKAIGTRTLNVPCTADIGWEKRTYTDPGTPPRHTPFEVVVNGKSWGMVEVK